MNRSNIPAANDRFVFIFLFWLNGFLHLTHRPDYVPQVFGYFLVMHRFSHCSLDIFACFNSWCSITSRCKSSYRLVATLVHSSSSSSSRPSTLPSFSSSRHSWHIIYTTAISINQSYNILLKTSCVAHP